MAGAVVAAPTNTGPSDPTAFGEAATNIDQAKAAALAALAAGGTAGLQAHLAAQAALGSDRQNAIQATLAAAGAAGAPAGAAQELQATLNAPYDQYAATNAALQTAGQQADAQRTAAAGTYFDEASAALPIVRAQAEGRLALARQAAAQNAQARQAAAAVTAQHDALSLQLAQLDLAKAQAGGGSAAGDPLTRYGGAATLGGILSGLNTPGGTYPGATSQLGLADEIAQSKANVSAGAGTGPSGAGGGNFDTPTQDQVNAQLDQAYGLPPGTTAVLANNYNQTQASKSTTAANATSSSAALRNDPSYGSAVNDLLASARANTYNYATFVGNVYPALVSKYGPDVTRQVLADYSALVPTKPANPNQQP